MVETIKDAVLKNENRYHVCLDDVPGKTADEMKEFFDYVPRQVLIPKINQIIAELGLKAYDENVFSKEEIYDLMSGMAKYKDVYLKNQVDDMLDAKQNSGECYLKTDADKIFGNLLKGSKSGKYLAIDDISPNCTNVAIKLRSKNILDIDKIGYSTTASFEFTENGIIIEGEGFISFDSDMKKDETYVFNCKCENENGDCSLLGKWGVEYTGGIMSDIVGYGTPLTLTSDAVAVCIYVNSSEGENGYAQLSEIMLEKGSVSTQYTPFVSELNRVPVKIGGKNLFDISMWNNSSVTDLNGLPCLKIKEWESDCFEIDAPYDTAFTFSCRTMRGEENRGKSSNLKAKRDEVERHIMGDVFYNTYINATVYGGEKLYFVGWSLPLYIDISSISLQLIDAKGEYEEYRNISTVFADENGNIDCDYSGGGLSVIVCEDGAVADVYYNRDINSVVSEFEKGE